MVSTSAAGPGRLLLCCAPVDPGGGSCGSAVQVAECPLLDALPAVAGLLALRWPVPPPATTMFLGFRPCVLVSSSDVIRHLRSATALEVFAHGLGRIHRAATPEGAVAYLGVLA